MEETQKRGRGRPKREGGRREPHTHRYDPATYNAAAELAEQRGDDLATDVLEKALKSYVRRHGSVERSHDDA